MKSLRRIALSTFGYDVRQLLLTDNMSVCLAFDRSRARNHSLLIQIRRFASYCLARNISCTVRWVPSELNSADHPSRLNSEESSKTLAHVIPAIRRPAAGENPSATPVAAKSGDEEWKETVTGPAKRASAQTTQGAHSPAEGFGQSPPHSKAAGPCLQLDRGAASHQTTGPGKKKARELKRVDQLHTEWDKGYKEGQTGPQGQTKGQAHGRFQLQSVLQIREASRTRPHEQAELRSAPPGLPQPDVCGWPSEFPCRQIVGSNLAPPPGVWENGEQASSALLEGIEGLSKTHPWQEPKSVPVGFVECHGRRDEKKRSLADGLVFDGGVVKLLPPLGAAESQGSLPGQASVGSDASVVPVIVARRGKDLQQDRGLRCARTPRQPVAHKLGPTTVRLAEAPSLDGALGLQLPRALHLGIDVTPYQTRHSGPSID